MSFTFDPFGAHITAAGELLYVSPSTGRMLDAPIRGGVPLIGPQFGQRLADVYPDEPNHGMLRREKWTVVEESDSRLVATLSHLGVDYRVVALFSEDRLDMELTAHNQTSAAAVLQLGFHPYFAVPDVRDVEVGNLSAAQVADFRGDQVYRDASRPVLTFDESGCDVGVRGVSRLVARDAQRGVEVSVSSRAADTFVVWNPGVEQAAGMGDLPDEGWVDFVCVEPMIHGPKTHGVVVDAGGSLMIDMQVQRTVL
ncbi:hypothetical protein [Corynebacterium aquilae]|uniref:Glucose-6-phosphate 1-epimerase n=1 Tax=Corynebacterium aquilae DSM 44791 TaxID=1431546 RepID=A0A1L7CFN5_9CORY|nr:hypothetical protein [Corynebacterium aquilae]APT84634.1 hypothetical protein CAQU_05645 [Corynebacterium aquilae DSM 44791]